MSELVRLTPEGFDIANAYVQTGGSVEEVAQMLQIPRHEVVAVLQKPDVKKYLDGVYLDLGYRNRNKLGAVLDRMIEAKLEEAEESGVFTSKDLLELLQFAHKMRMDEIKAQGGQVTTAVQINHSGDANHFGDTAYGKLMEKLLNGNNRNKG